VLGAGDEALVDVVGVLVADEHQLGVVALEHLLVGVVARG
jgi:hypothetical protein